MNEQDNILSGIYGLFLFFCFRKILLQRLTQTPKLPSTKSVYFYFYTIRIKYKLVDNNKHKQQEIIYTQQIHQCTRSLPLSLSEALFVSAGIIAKITLPTGKGSMSRTMWQVHEWNKLKNVCASLWIWTFNLQPQGLKSQTSTYTWMRTEHTHFRKKGSNYKE